jgi:RNA polymerase-binding protein DksA
MPNLDAPLNNSPYSEDELDHFKELLEEEKNEAESEIQNLKESIEDLTGSQDDEYSSAAHHQGNVASEEEEKETLFKLIERNKNKIKEIKAALDRIEKGNYGICEETGEKIQKERLKAIPYARYSVNARKKDDEFQRPPKV